MTDASALKNFILELGVEELPAGLVRGISEHIKNSIANLLKENEIAFKEIENQYTPRRLFFCVHELEAQVADKELEIKGPPEKIAVQGSGNTLTYTQAALGFAKKNGVEESQLTVKDGYVYAKVFVKGVSSQKLLEENLESILNSVPGERFMRWANGEVKFSRPIQWLASVIYDEKSCETLSFNLENLASANKSYGHRFLGPEAFEIKSREQYINELRDKGVYIDVAERKQVIRTKSEELAKSINGKVEIDEELLDEVANLVENPTPVLCEFDKQYLEVPECVLVTVMAVHQRYFPVYDSNSKLLANFITVSNNPLPEAKQNIKSGNEKVIIPRFKDAEFFFKEDSKLSLEKRLEKLEKINFQAGNLFQKAQRIQKISEFLAKELSAKYDLNPAKLVDENLDAESQKNISRAALLSKSDLTSQMVFEFTELQGEIGGIYAAREKEAQQVADAISEHYRPRYAGDNIPSNIGAKIISVADKLDSIACIFALGKIPKGSADPFALRRQANGLLEIIIHSHFILDVDKLIDFSIDLAKAQFGSGRKITKTRGKGDNKKVIETDEFDWEEARANVKDFISQRLEFVFAINHKDLETNKAVLASPETLTKLNTKHMMIHYVMSLKEDSRWSELLEALTRISNIGDKTLGLEVDEAKFTDASEKEFFSALKDLNSEFDKEIINEVNIDREKIFALIKPIHKFFDNVLVNDEDQDIRKNRHSLVNFANSLALKIADFKAF